MEKSIKNYNPTKTTKFLHFFHKLSISSIVLTTAAIFISISISGFKYYIYTKPKKLEEQKLYEEAVALKKSVEKKARI